MLLFISFSLKQTMDCHRNIAILYFQATLLLGSSHQRAFTQRRCSKVGIITHKLTIRPITVDIAMDLGFGAVAQGITTSGIAMAAHETTVAVADGVFELARTACDPLLLVVRDVAGVPVAQDTCVGQLTGALIVKIRAEGAVGTRLVFLASSTAVIGIGPVVVVNVVAELDCKS
jgi:hypothetical protein